MAKEILVIDDNFDIRQLISGILKDQGMAVREAANYDQAILEINKKLPDVVVIDVKLDKGDNDSIELLVHLKKIDKDVRAIMISGHANVQMAVDALKLGAFEFMQKPFSSERLLNFINRAIENIDLKKEKTALENKLFHSYDIIGKSHAIEKIKSLISKLSNTESRIFISGPTGSGKTTSLYAALNRLYDPRKKIITIEDPVEYELNGINQIPVNPKRGLTFASGLRSILRQDPDIIFVGEIRDGETADISIRSALTGHLIFSTIHTNDAVSSIGRLIDMGVEPYLVASVLEGALAQRLGRRICEDCKKQVPLSDDLSHRLNTEERAIFSNGMWIGEGCEKCNNSGSKGRVGFFELVVVNAALRAAISDNRSAADLTASLSQSHITMRQDAFAKAASGITTIAEVLRATQDTDIDY